MTTPIHLDPAGLQAQRAARDMVQRDNRILMALTLVGLAGLFAVLLVYSRAIPVYLAIFLYFVFYVIIRLAANWRQWQALLVNDVHCPHCRKPVAERAYLLKGPTPLCPHCGLRALATLQQLKETET